MADPGLTGAGKDAGCDGSPNSNHVAVYIEETTGDHGDRTPGACCNSPDIRLNYGTVNDGFGIVGQLNTLGVRPHVVPSCLANVGGGHVKVQLWVCEPFFTPAIIGNVPYVREAPGSPRNIATSNFDPATGLYTGAPDGFVDVGP